MNGRDPRFRVWRGLGIRSSANEECEEEFRRPVPQQQSQPFESAIDVQAMVANAFQQLDDHVLMGKKVVDITEDVFRVANGLEEKTNEGDIDGATEIPFDIEDQQPLGDVPFEDVHREHNFDPMALEDAMKELFIGTKCTKLIATILLMNLCTIHGMNNKFANELFVLFTTSFAS